MSLHLNNCLLTLMLCLCLALGANPAQAHRVNLFCSVQQKQVLCEASFADGSPVSGAKILVRAKDPQKELLRKETNEQGQARFALPKQVLQTGADLEVILQASMGHRDTWTIPAQEYARLEQSADDQGIPAKKGQDSRENSSRDETRTGQGNGFQDWPSQEQLRKIVAQEVSQELQPLLQEPRSRNKTSLRDILAGLGYILGLAGIAFYFKGRKGQ
jgi:nickel transport protein